MSMASQEAASHGPGGAGARAGGGGPQRCPRCAAENPGRTSFCGRCGTRLTSRCARCGAESPPGFQFCGECGLHLPESHDPDAAEPTAEPRDAPAERRQLTVMFSDLVGSTPLAERLDPETLRAVVLSYQAVCVRVIRRFEGYLARYLGDGVLVYFGYPQAHEDDAQRAVRAALGIVTELREVNDRLEREHGVRLAARIGIHTGLVVAGEMGAGGARDPLAIVGETPNVASRLQEVAEPDTVVISESTHALARGYFEYADLGPRALKGLSHPVRVFRVLRESAARTRLEVARTAGLTPLVGREQEASLLLERWEQVREGIGQVVLLSGEAGIGKSRLLEVVKERVAREPHVWLEARGSPYHQNSALHPTIELLRRVLDWDRDDSPERRLHRLEGVLGRFPLAREEAVPLLAHLLSIPLPEGYPPLALSAQRQKQKTFEVVLAMLLEIAAEQPVLLVVEDVHWVDPSTLELLGRLIDQGPAARILTVLTFRPEFVPPWSGRSHLTHITLNRLARRHVEEMVQRLAGGRALPPEVLQQLVARTDGVPLFVEELTKMLLESGWLHRDDGHYVLAGPLPPLAIPTTLHDSLMARLDRLSAAREVAQLGATLGREFSYDLLRAVSPLEEEHLQSELKRLVATELLYQRGVPPQATYLFKHALIQEAAYLSMLRSTRQLHHLRVAQVLAERFPDVAENQPEVIAHHYTEAGAAEQAAVYWQLAGLRATQRSAHVEAIHHVHRGLALLPLVPDGPERAQQELLLQIALAVPLIATRGYAAPDTEQAFARARALCQQLGDPAHLFPVLRGLWEFYVVRGMARAARELAAQLLALAHEVEEPDLLLEAHFALGETSFFLGEFADAEQHLGRGIALYDPARHRDHAYLYGEDPGVMCRAYAAWNAWHLGCPDRAVAWMEDAIALAERGAHPFTLAIALSFGAALHHLRGEERATRAHAERAIALSREQGFPLWLAMATMFRGWVTFREGDHEGGIAEIREGLAAWRGTGTGLGLPFVLGMLADAYGETGRAADGLAALDEAFAAARASGERHFEPELHRLRGRLLLAMGARGVEAEACLRRALALAREQGGRALELRAATSLAYLLGGNGRREEGRAVLAACVETFTEGLETEDLGRARAMLEALA